VHVGAVVPEFGGRCCAHRALDATEREAYARVPRLRRLLDEVVDGLWVAREQKRRIVKCGEILACIGRRGRSGSKRRVRRAAGCSGRGTHPGNDLQRHDM